MVAALRQVVFEAQTLLISQVKALVERRDDDSKIELAPAERTSRIREQAKRLVGVPLEGATECAHSSYDLVMKVLEENTPYLPSAEQVSIQAFGAAAGQATEDVDHLCWICDCQGPKA